jgi:SAM-dependent methyltransferase
LFCDRNVVLQRHIPVTERKEAVAMTDDHDHGRYDRDRLLESERAYGPGFQSPGGEEAVAAFAADLKIEPGDRILDVGSGTGGAARYLARTFQAHVVAVDHSADCVALARERAQADLAAGVDPGAAQVHFQQMDARALAVGPASFDLVWSRDTLACIDRKLDVLAGIRRALRPGGGLFLTDFCTAARPSAGFRAYADACGWSLFSLDDYRRAMVDMGFVDVEVDDISPDLTRWMEIELDRLDGDAARLQERWRTKLAFCHAGDLVWARCTARRP